jgi:hypothetical protein
MIYLILINAYFVAALVLVSSTPTVRITVQHEFDG